MSRNTKSSIEDKVAMINSKWSFWGVVITAIASIITTILIIRYPQNEENKNSNPSTVNTVQQQNDTGVNNNVKGDQYNTTAPQTIVNGNQINNNEGSNTQKKDNPPENQSKKSLQDNRKGNFNDNVVNGDLTQNYYEGPPPPKIELLGYNQKNARTLGSICSRKDSIYFTQYEISYNSQSQKSTLTAFVDNPYTICVQMICKTCDFTSSTFGTKMSNVQTPISGTYVINISTLKQIENLYTDLKLRVDTLIYSFP